MGIVDLVGDSNSFVPYRDRSPQIHLPVEIASLDVLESLIAEAASHEDERARSTVRELLDEALDLHYEETVADMPILEHFTGQVIRDGNKIVNASLPATSAFVKSQEWTRAEPFAI